MGFPVNNARDPAETHHVLPAFQPSGLRAISLAANGYRHPAREAWENGSSSARAAKGKGQEVTVGWLA
jgi:hypothetical protein